MKDGIIKPFLKTLVSVMSVLLWSIINFSGVYKFGDGLKISPTAVCLSIKTNDYCKEFWPKLKLVQRSNGNYLKQRKLNKKEWVGTDVSFEF